MSQLEQQMNTIRHGSTNTHWGIVLLTLTQTLIWSSSGTSCVRVCVCGGSGGEVQQSPADRRGFQAFFFLPLREFLRRCFNSSLAPSPSALLRLAALHRHTEVHTHTLSNGPFDLTRTHERGATAFGQSQMFRGEQRH